MICKICVDMRWYCHLLTHVLHTYITNIKYTKQEICCAQLCFCGEFGWLLQAEYPSTATTLKVLHYRRELVLTSLTLRTHRGSQFFLKVNLIKSPLVVLNIFPRSWVMAFAWVRVLLRMSYFNICWSLKKKNFYQPLDIPLDTKAWWSTLAGYIILQWLALMLWLGSILKSHKPWLSSTSNRSASFVCNDVLWQFPLAQESF